MQETVKIEGEPESDTPEVHEHRHNCFACGEVVPGAKCSDEIKYCKECLALTHYERATLRHQNSMAQPFFLASESIMFMANLMESHFYDPEDDKEPVESVQ